MVVISKLFAFTSPLRISLMSLPFLWGEFCPERGSIRMKVVIRGFTEPTVAVGPPTAYEDMEFCTKSHPTAYIFSDEAPWDIDTWGSKNSRSWSNTTGTALFLRWYALFHWEEREKRSQELETFGEMCSVPPHRLSDPIFNWNYLWTGINRSFDYEPSWHKKETNTTEMQLMNLFVTPGSEKSQRDTLRAFIKDSLQLCDRRRVGWWSALTLQDRPVSSTRKKTECWVYFICGKYTILTFYKW